jgi:hypothetical protein
MQSIVPSIREKEGALAPALCAPLMAARVESPWRWGDEEGQRAQRLRGNAFAPFFAPRAADKIRFDKRRERAEANGRILADVQNLESNVVEKHDKIRV